MTTITHPDPAVQIGRSEREACLQNLFGPDTLLGELHTLAIQDLMTDARIRGEWFAMETKTGVRFLMPPITEPISLTILTNGYAGKLSPEAAGVIFTSFGLVMLMEANNDDPIPFESHEKLMRWARQHPEGRYIEQALD